MSHVVTSATFDIKKSPTFFSDQVEIVYFFQVLAYLPNFFHSPMIPASEK